MLLLDNNPNYRVHNEVPTMRQLAQTPDDPEFVTEHRGGWDAWDTERTVIVGVSTPSGIELTTGDTVTVDVAAAPAEIPTDATEITATVEMGSWVGDGRKVEIESDSPWFTTLLDESEFRAAWGDWLKL